MKNVTMKLLPVYAFVIPLLLIAGCKNPTSPPTSKPKVNNVSITPNNSGGNVIEVPKGGSKQFTATVDVSNGAATTVTWSVTGKSSSQTTISSTGLLAVGTDETAATLTVTATSTADTKKTASVTVTVIEQGGGREKLPTPGTPQLSNEGVATWTYTADADVTEYKLQLYKGAAGSQTALGSPVSISKGTFTHSFISAMRTEGVGVYSFTITAIGDGVSYSNSDESNKSGTQTVTQRPMAAGLSWSGDTAQWTAGTGDTTSLRYQVKLYKNGDFIIGKEYTQTELSKDFSADVSGTGVYTFTVTALGNDYLVLGAAPAESPPNPKLIVENVWLVGTMNSSTLPGMLMPKNNDDGTFIWEGNAEVAANSTFRFSLSNTTSWEESWFAPENDGDVVTLGSAGNDMQYFPTSADKKTWKITDAGWYKFIVNPVEMKLYVYRPVEVTAITINSPPSQLLKGNSHDFTENLNLTGKNTELATIEWTVTGGISGTAFGANSNRLTIAADETATFLNITARFGTVESLPVTILVKDPADYGNAVIKLTVTDQGGSLAVSGIPSTPPTIYKTGGVAGTDDTLTVTVSNPNGAYTYFWYVGNVKQPEGITLTINAADYAVGYHTVRLTVTINGVPWSIPDELGFTVAAVK